MAPTLQHRQAALIAGISSTSTPNFCAAAAPARWKVSYAVVSVMLVQNIRQAKVKPSIAAKGRHALMLARLHPAQMREDAGIVGIAAAIGDNPWGAIWRAQIKRNGTISSHYGSADTAATTAI